MSVNKSNFLIQHASYSLNLNQLKILNKIINLIDTEKREQYYYFDFNKFITEELHLNINNYNRIKADLKKMREKTIKILDKNDLNKSIEVYTGWISSYEFIEGSSKVKIEIPQMMKKYYNDLQKYYTEIDATITYGLKSQYSIRLYELLSSYKNKKQKFDKDKPKNKKWYVEELITYNKLRKLLDVEETKYKIYSDFRKKVIETAQKELEEKNTDIQFDFELSGRGSKKLLTFRIYKRDKEVPDSLDVELKKIGFTEKEIKKLNNMYDYDILMSNLKYCLKIQKKGGIKVHIIPYYRKAVENDFASTVKESSKESITENQTEEKELTDKTTIEELDFYDKINLVANNDNISGKFISFYTLYHNQNARFRRFMEELNQGGFQVALANPSLVEPLLDKFFKIFKNIEELKNKPITSFFEPEEPEEVAF